MGDSKTRLSILWVILAVGVVDYLVLDLLKTGNFQIDPLMSVNNWSLLVYMFVLMAPLVMAFLSQILTDNVNRWANIIVGAIMGIFTFITLIASLVIEQSVLAINLLFGIGWLVLIVWYAWKSKQKT